MSVLHYTKHGGGVAFQDISGLIGRTQPRCSPTMAGPEDSKLRGLQFAERQLLRHGWEQGKGLGKRENGISEAIKVKVKCDKSGVGHREGEQFTFHWWDHVFNKASSNLAVEASEGGVQLKKLAEEKGGITNKKPRSAELGKAKLYGRFVKSATLLSGGEQVEERAVDSGSSDSDSSDEDEKLDLSSCTRLSDADLVKACGGRTAHKGARHGFKMSAKLARLEEQEREFLAKYREKNQEPSKPTTTEAAGAHRQRHGKRDKNSCRERDVPTPDSGGEPEDGNAETREKGLSKKKKKKRAKTPEEEFQGGAEEPGEEGMMKKKRKREQEKEALQEETTPQDSERKPKKKRRRSKAVAHE
ncbi:G patch domain-containing protein 4 isoform X1 [Polyodon spathula]|uniref:G patch domain-containing protein 4 isoform X1 n=1 Tax=Polyodon spathula TaxID=7913 RepID=UPI001B7DB4FE|nr:G patch domain-containing protein 4 isoform X1 [Polyodon spathula]